MIENPPPAARNQTNLSDAVRTRWLSVLRSLLTRPIAPVDSDIGPGLTVLQGHNRRFIVACLKAVHAVRNGRSVTVTIDLPAMPLPLPASQGNLGAELVWLAYLKFTQGDTAAALWLERACAALCPTGLKTTASDNPEPWWQNEMLILHALHSYALISHSPAAFAKTIACADFHVREIQPDHATNEPWSAHAYASHPDGSITAETLLHSAQIQNAGALTDIAQFIVHDAVCALEAAGRA